MARVMRPPSPTALAALILLAAPARAQAEGAGPRTVRAGLALRFEAGAEQCPGEPYLRAEVARRLGYDPFAADGAGRFVGVAEVVIARVATGLTATVTFADAAGVPRAHHTVPVRGADRGACEVALAGVAVALRPELRAPDEEAPGPPPAPPAPVPAPPPLTPPPLPDLRPRLEVGAAVFGGVGTAPGPTLGGALHAGLVLFPFGLDRGRLALALEGRVDAPATSAAGIRTRLVAGSFVGCGHRDLGAPAAAPMGAFLCAVATAGVVRGARGAAVTVGSTYLGVGGRLGLEMRVTSLLALRVQGEIVPTVVAGRVGPRAVAASAGTGDVAGTAGVAMVLSF